MNPDAELLETFVVAGEELHFANAAARLHLDPSSVSRRLRQLESRTGIELFDRTTRAVALTEAGGALLPVARRALAELRTVDATVQALRRSQVRMASVGMLAHSADTRLLTLLDDKAAALGLDLETAEYGFDDPSAGVRDGTTDLGIVFEPIDPTGLEILPLLSVPRIAIVSSRHRLANRTNVTLDEILDEPWIAPSCTDTVFVDHWMAIAHRGGAEPIIGATVHTSEAGLLAVMSGKGISAGATARPHFEMDGLSIILITDLPPAVISVARRTDHTSDAIRELAQHLHQQLWDPDPPDERPS